MTYFSVSTNSLFNSQISAEFNGSDRNVLVSLFSNAPFATEMLGPAHSVIDCAFTSPHIPLRWRQRFRSNRGVRNIVCAALGVSFVAGANRGVGLCVARALREKGASRIIGTSRENSAADDLKLFADDVELLDVLDRNAVSSSLISCSPDVVFCCFGGTVDTSELPDYIGVQNLVDAAKDSGVKRFMLVSALGAGDSQGCVPFQVMDTMRPLLLEKSRAELYLRESGLSWTIIRPGPLVDEPVTGSAVLTQGKKCYGTISRTDLARTLVEVAISPRAVDQTLAVVDRTNVLITSPYVRPLEFWENLPFKEFEL